VLAVRFVHLLEDADVLRFAESGQLHAEGPLLGVLCSQMAQVFKGTSFPSNPDVNWDALSDKLSPPKVMDKFKREFIEASSKIDAPAA
jgi:hypothetical protein